MPPSNDKPAPASGTDQEAEFRLLADNIPTLCWIADAAGWISFYNRRWYDYTGLTAEQMQGWGWQDVHDPAVLPAVLERWRAAIASGEPFEMTFPLRGADGSFRPFLTRAHPARDEHGTVVRWFGINTDIAEQRETEERLRASEARLQRLLATIPAGVVELDKQGFFSYANPAAERALGAGPHDLVGRRYDDPAWEVTDRKQVPIPPHLMPGALALQGQGVQDFEYATTTLDGRRVVLLVDAVAVRDGYGRIEGALAAFQDVTARRAQAHSLSESEARFRHMADSAPALIWMTDPAGHVTFANMHFEYLFGQLSHSFHGDAWKQIVVPSDLRRFRQTYLSAAHWRRSFRAEVRVVDKAASVRWLRCEGVRRLDDAGAFLGYTGCAVDMTEARVAAEELEARVARRTADLMLAEEQLRQAQKMEAVGQLTGGIAHDFNNMLQAIGSNLELLRRRLSQGRGQDAEGFATSAQQMVDRAAALTYRLLAFARRQQLQPEPTQPIDLIEGMTELIRRSVGPEISIELRMNSARRPVICDASQLENALLNLAINARDAMPDGGRLVIRCDDRDFSAADIAGQEGVEPGSFIEISVSDTGTGMTDEVASRVFEPFFTTKPIGRGTGLGLSQTYGFVRQSGGFVRLDTVLGQGTTVHLYLPRRETAQIDPPPGPVHEPPTRANGQVVLLVEDEAPVRAAAAEHLRDIGYLVLEAINGDAAVVLLRSGTPIDILATDVGLPDGMNGRQLADLARKHRPSLPILFITGYAGVALEGQLAPGMAVLNKPFTLDTFAARLSNLLRSQPLPETVPARW